jgi:hypothetical protein
MCVQRLGHGIDEPSTLARHAPWWLRSHWGRAFEILSLRSSSFARGQPGEGLVLEPKKGVSLTRDDLERPDPDDPRELEAQRQQLVVLEEEAVALRREYEASMSWQVTRPLRAAGRMVRSFRSRRSR